MDKSKAVSFFSETIKSDFTKKSYLHHLSQFLRFTKIKDYDTMLDLDSKKIQEFLEDYLIYCKGHNSLNSIKTKFACLKSFFTFHKDDISFNRIKRMYPAQTVKISGFKAYTVEQIRTLLENTLSRPMRHAIMFMSASGVRVGALYELKLKHLEKMPDGCKSVLVYPDSKDEYITFITPECVKYLDNYLEYRKEKGEKITQESFLFVNHFGKPYEPGKLSSYISKYVRTLTSRNKINNNRYDVMACHGLRKYFNTVLKLRTDINSNIAERLMGHSRTIQLDNSYFTPTKDQLFTEYRKAISDLSIHEKYKLQIDIVKEKEIQSQADLRILALEKKLDVLTEFVKTFHN